MDFAWKCTKCRWESYWRKVTARLAQGLAQASNFGYSCSVFGLFPISLDALDWVVLRRLTLIISENGRDELGPVVALLYGVWLWGVSIGALMPCGIGVARFDAGIQAPS